MSVVEKIKQHPLIIAITLGAAIVAATWLTLDQVLIRPRDFIIEQQRTEIERLRSQNPDKVSTDGRAQMSTGSEAESNRWLTSATGDSLWIPRNHPTLILSNQVVVIYRAGYPALNDAEFSLQVAGTRQAWTDVERGDSKTLGVGSHEYLLTLVDMTYDGAALRLDRRVDQ